MPAGMKRNTVAERNLMGAARRTAVRAVLRLQRVSLFAERRWLLGVVGTVVVAAGMGCSSLDFSDTEFSRDILRRERPSAARHLRRGVKLLKSGHLERAETAFDEALLLDENLGAAHNNLGRLYFERGDLLAAMNAFQRATELLPRRAEPLNNLAMTFEESGRYLEAIELYEGARALEPENPEFLGNLIRTRLRQGVVDYRLQQELGELILIETRPEWRAFAKRQLTMMSRATDRGPSRVESAIGGEEEVLEELPEQELPDPELLESLE